MLNILHLDPIVVFSIFTQILVCNNLSSQTGKVDPHHPKVSGHRGNVLDIKWNPFNDFCIASCSEDTTVSVEI